MVKQVRAGGKKDGIVLRLDRLGRETRLLGCDNLGLWKSILVKASLRATGREKMGREKRLLGLLSGVRAGHLVEHGTNFFGLAGVERVRFE